MPLLRNNNERFSMYPTSNMPRSAFDRPSEHKTTMNAGELVPIYVDLDVFPGTTYTMDVDAIVRMSTPIYPVMDNAFMDIFWFAIPYRLVWEHTKEFFGENTTDKWTQTTIYEIPQLKAPVGGWKKGTLADYMGIRPGIENITVSALPFRAYCMVYNEWFRDENLQDIAYVNKDDTTQDGHNGSNYVTDAQKGGMPCPVCKFHDYFTSALPQPQKGEPVAISAGGNIPILGNGKTIGFTNNSSTAAGVAGLYADDYQDAGNYKKTVNICDQAINKPIGYTLTSTNLGSGPIALSTLGLPTKEQYEHDPIKYNSNMYADLSTATAITIADLRRATAIQRFLEKDAVGGTRYQEIIKSHFDVDSKDARLQIPEYLGGTRVPINVNQVLQTSATNETSPQGNTGAYSLTGIQNNSFTKSFTEHTILLGLACIRTNQTYSQGIERQWLKKNKFDFYWPEFNNIGEQEIYNEEIFAQGTDEDKEVFGYQERYAEYKYKPSRISGEFRPDYEKTLDAWHYGAKYNNLPVLGDEFIRETKNNVDRTLAIKSNLQDQFICDFGFSLTMVAPMPMYSVPGIGSRV